MAGEWLTLKEAARALRVSELTVRRWLHRGLIRGARLPTARAGWRIPQSEVARLLALRDVPAERASEARPETGEVAHATEASDACEER